MVLLAGLAAGRAAGSAGRDAVGRPEGGNTGRAFTGLLPNTIGRPVVVLVEPPRHAEKERQNSYTTE